MANVGKALISIKLDDESLALVERLERLTDRLGSLNVPSEAAHQPMAAAQEASAQELAPPVRAGATDPSRPNSSEGDPHV